MIRNATEYSSSFFPSEYYEDELEPGSIPANKVKTIAFYLPQFHAIPQNDKWWGKGFTEWTNVTRAVPLFEGHHQPQLPLDLGFYNLTDPEVLRRQAKMAKKHGVDGFCFHHYWFLGERLLEKPLELFLANQDIDIGFCICWANESWTRRWDGSDNEVLINQNHCQEDDLLFIEELLPVFKDQRYIRIDGRPLLVIYRADIFPDFKATVKLWKGYCKSNKLPEPYVVIAQTFGIKDPRPFNADAAVEFPPHGLPNTDITKAQGFITDTFYGKISDYEQVVEHASNQACPEYKVFRTAFPGWDNTARKGLNCHAFANNTPKLFQHWLESNIKHAKENLSVSEQAIFINAWNEWAEGAHLEPDRRYGYANLNAVQRAHCLLPNDVDRELTNSLRQRPPVMSRNEFFDSFCEYHFVELCFRLIQDKAFDIQIYGAGEGGRQLINLLRLSGQPFKIHCILDRTAIDISFELEGIDVLPPDRLMYDVPNIVIASKAFKQEIIKTLMGLLSGRSLDNYKLYR